VINRVVVDSPELPALFQCGQRTWLQLDVDPALIVAPVARHFTAHGIHLVGHVKCDPKVRLVSSVNCVESSAWVTALSISF